MNREDAEEYTQALGQVVAGGWRLIAVSQNLGVPAALGLSLENWVQQRLGGYVKLSIPERREAVTELVAEGKPNTEIAAVLGVTESTIRNDRRASQNCEPDEELPEIQATPSQNCEPVADFDLIDAELERQEQIDRVRQNYPERFAADEIFDIVRFAIEQAQPWLRARQPWSNGEHSDAEWTELLGRWDGTLTRLMDWRGHKEAV